MTKDRTVEVLRLGAVDGDSGNAVLPDWASTLVVQNALDATIFIAYRSSPSPDNVHNGYDVVVPGSALLAIPIPIASRQIIAAVKYPGAVPAGDSGLVCLVLVSESQLTPSVGPLS